MKDQVSKKERYFNFIESKLAKYSKEILWFVCGVGVVVSMYIIFYYQITN